MAFAGPWWLLLLLLWPLLVLLMRKREQQASRPAADFLLWQRAAARLPHAAFRARLSMRDGLWILPLALVTLGLARPEWRRAAQPVECVVLVDRSASMTTSDATGSTRSERGERERERLLGSQPFRVEAMPQELSEATLAADDLVEAALLRDAAGIPVLVVTDLPLDLPASIGLIAIRDDARNAGITAAGFDPAQGLLVRVAADPGAGPRTLEVKDERGTTLFTQEIPDPTSFRIVLPPSVVGTAPSSLSVSLKPEDAMRRDDAVRLEAARPALSAAIEKAPPPFERALRAIPGVAVVSGEDAGADLVVGATKSTGAFRLLLPPIAGVDGFATGPARAATGAMSGTGTFSGLVGPTQWPALYPLLKEPPGTERLLEIGSEPLLVRNGRTFALLADPEANGWSAIPSFPLTVARIVEIAASGAKARLEATAAVLSAEETHVARGPAPASRLPRARMTGSPPVLLAPLCYALAAIAVLAILLPALISRRASATPRNRPASALAAAIRQTERS